MAKQISLAGHNGRDHAWAIELKHNEKARRDRGERGIFGPEFAGIFNWIAGPVALGQQGVTTAFWSTREEARAARWDLHQFGQRRAVVRKVRVHIEVLPERKKP